MFRIILFSSFLVIGCTMLSAQNDQPTDQPDMNETMEQAFGEISKMLDTLDMESIFGEGGMEGLLKGFSFDGKEMQDLNGAMDSLGLSELLGGDISKMLEQGLQGMDMRDMDKMMEEGLGMMKDMDMDQFQKMLEGIDLSEMMKMFEGMNLDDFNGVMPPTMPEDTPTGTKGKKLKKI